MSHYDEAFNDGLEAAARHLQRKADKIRFHPEINPGPSIGQQHMADTMARIFEAEATEILALTRGKK